MMEAIKSVNNKLRNTRFLHGLSGEITASSGFGRNERTSHVLNNTTSSANALIQRNKVVMRRIKRREPREETTGPAVDSSDM